MSAKPKQGPLAVALDGLEAFGDGRGFEGKHLRAVRLIAAAPDLLAAAKSAREKLACLCGAGWNNRREIRRLDRAIKKAERGAGK